MRQAGLLVASFVVTLTVLSGGFFVMQAFAPAPEPTAAPTATPASATAAPAATASAAPSVRPTAPPAATSSPAATPSSGVTPAPAATPPPTAEPTAAASPVASAPAGSPAASASAPTGPEGKIQVVVLGSQYSSSTIPANGAVKRGNGGLITFTTTRTLSDPLELEWDLPANAIPAGFTIRSIDVRICGSGSGDFWETYGPTGSSPDEIEAKPPQADGCWHYTGAPGPDTMVKAAIRLQSTMTVTRIEYTVIVSK